VNTLAKRTGTQQQFSSTKLEGSLTRAGAKKTEAHDIANRLTPNKDETTKSFRTRVATDLRGKNPTAAGKFETTRRLSALTSGEVSADRAQMHPDTMKAFGLKANAGVTAEHAGKTRKLRAEGNATLEPRQVRIHPDTAKQLGTTASTRLAFTLK